MSDPAVAPVRTEVTQVYVPPALPSWPLMMMFAAVPLWWVLGGWYLMWPFFGLFLGLLMLVRGRIRMPAGSTYWVIFLGLVLVSATRLDRVTAVLTYGLRFGHMITAFLVGVYVYTLAREGMSWRRLMAPVCWFWLGMVLLGWMGVLWPTFTTASPVEILLPDSIAGERFMQAMVHLHFTEFNALGRQPIYRTAAPYPYTNNWGTAFALLIPFLLAYLTSVRRGPMRVVLLVSLPFALVPAFLTLNRGMFIGLFAGMAYLVLRALARGEVRYVLPIAGLVGVGWLVSLVIPVGTLISERTGRTDSTSDRADLYVQTWNAVLNSPLLGFGVSNKVDTTHAAEPLGTQGQFWQVMYSYGIPAVLCSLLLLVVLTRRLGAAVSPAGRWLSTIPVIGLVITPFYGYTDPNMSIMFFAVGLGLAALDGPVNRDGARTR